MTRNGTSDDLVNPKCRGSCAQSRSQLFGEIWKAPEREIAEGWGIHRAIHGGRYPKGRRRRDRQRHFLVGMGPSIRFGDKERGLRGLVKLVFDARGARQKF